MADLKNRRPSPVSRELTDKRVEGLVRFNLWPDREHLDHSAWLKNFTDEERPYAINILNVHIHYNEKLTNALFQAAVHALSAEWTADCKSPSEASRQWASFLSSVVVTYIQDETPSAVGSGRLFANKARNVLGIDEAQILDPTDALIKLKGDKRTVGLLVDDFVGSGRQAIDHWHRFHSIYEGSSARTSFGKVVREQESRVYYTPLIATKYGIGQIRERCPHLKLRPAHVLDERYSLTSKDSKLWPEQLKSTAFEVLQAASKRAGIDEDTWRGHHDLSLALSFHHCVPDATMPLIYWEQGGWKPLLRRRAL